MIIVVVVPFLDEERYLPAFLQSLAAQQRLPDRLVLVDDGSGDASAGMVADFAADHRFATVLRRAVRPREPDRLATAAELRAFQWAVGQLDEPWDLVAKLDADLLLTPDLIATLEEAFEQDARLGMAGPYLSTLEPGGARVRQRCPPHHVEGPAKFYRRKCFEEISPLPPILGWDTIDELRAQMRGWRTASVALPGGDPLHLRVMGSHDGRLRAWRRWGACAYGYGEHPLHVLLVAGQRLGDRPPLLGAVSYVAGWATAAIHRAPRAEPELRAYARRDQLTRIRQRLRRLFDGRSAVHP